MRAPGFRRWPWVGGALLLVAGLGLLWPGGPAGPRLRPGLSSAHPGGPSASARGVPPGGRGQQDGEASSARGALHIRGTVMSFLGQPVEGASLVALPHAPEDTSRERLCRVGQGKPQPGLWECAVDESDVERLVDEARASLPPAVRATSDARGHFELAGLREGTYEVWVDAPQGVALRRVAAGEEALELTLEEGLALRGFALDDAGEPLAGVPVVALPRQAVHLLESSTGPDGLFDFGRVPTHEYLLHASLPGLLPGVRPDMGELQGWVVLELLTPRAVEGRVVRQGQGVPEAPVHLRGRGSREGVSRSTRTDALGRFTFDGVGRGRYVLETPSGSGRVSALARVDEGPRPEPVLLELAPCAALEGVVRGEAAGPLAHARVHLSDRDARFQAEAPTDARGHYRLECVAPGDFTARASARGFQAARAGEAPAPLAPGESRRLDFQLEAAAPFAGTVVDEEGQGVAGVVLYLEPLEGAGVESATTDGRGRFAFDGLAAGPHRLECEAPGGLEPLFEEVEVPRVDARVVLRRAEARPGVLVGTVLDARGRPQVDAHVRAWREDGEREEQAAGARTNAAGHFRLRGLAVGHWRVEATPAGLSLPPAPEARARVEVHGPEPVVVRLRLEEGLEVTGEVVDTHGAPVRDATLRVGWRGLGEEWSEVGLALTDARGHFTLRHLPPGEVRLEVRPLREELLLRTARRVVRAGDSGVRIVLEPVRRVSGRVVREDGAPVEAFSVNGTPFSDAGGRFWLPFEPAGRQAALLFTARGLAPALRRVTLDVDSDAVLPDVVLRAARPVRGRVVDAATGAPLALARVSLFDVDARLEELAHETDAWVVWTAEDGSFVLPGAAPGATLTLAAEGYLDATVALPEGTDDVVLRLRPRGAEGGSP